MACGCDEFASSCQRDQNKYYQHMSDDTMYSRFKAVHPTIAEHCSQTTFMGMKPWYISRPHKRSCECTYHSKYVLLSTYSNPYHSMNFRTSLNVPYLNSNLCLFSYEQTRA